jgi:hypothetical protein
MAHRFGRCPRCNGALFCDGEELNCVNCGYTAYLCRRCHQAVLTVTATSVCCPRCDYSWTFARTAGNGPQGGRRTEPLFHAERHAKLGPPPQAAA